VLAYLVHTYPVPPTLTYMLRAIASLRIRGGSRTPVVRLTKSFDVSHCLAYAALTTIGYPLESLESLCLIERIQRRTC
jgi:hypothetical protein